MARFFVITLALVPLAWGSSQPPHVILLIADDLGWGDLSVYGNSSIRTPHLERFARQGTTLTQFYINSPICSASRAALLTGRFPSKVGISRNVVAKQRIQRKSTDVRFLSPAHPTISRWYQKHGYRTVHIGKWHLGETLESPPLSDYGYDVSLTHDTFDRKCNDYLYLTPAECRPRTSFIMVEEALRLLHASPKPTFLQIWFYDLHEPLHPLPSQLAAYPSLFGARQAYTAAVSELDRQIGYFLTGLERMKLASKSIVVFSSDNGPETYITGGASLGSTGPFRGTKRSLYEGGIRVPFIIRWPGQIPAGKVNTHTVASAVDLFPTLTRMSGIKSKQQVLHDGDDLSQELLGKQISKAQQRSPLFWHVNGCARSERIANVSAPLAIREGRWKLLHDPASNHTELYDFSSDTLETDNVAHSYPDVSTRLLGKLKHWAHALPLPKRACVASASQPAPLVP